MITLANPTSEAANTLQEDATPSANIAEPQAVARRGGWLTRAISGENVLLFILGARWLSLLPPLLTVLLRPHTAHGSLAMLCLAVAINMALSMWHPRINRWFVRRPLLLCCDLVLVAILLAFTGGSQSPYFLYALTPLVAASFFFQIRGGLSAATAFSPLFLVAVFYAWDRTGVAPDPVLVFTQLLALFAVALVCGFPSLLLSRLRATSNELQRANTALSRAETMAALGKMVGYLSHEIRNPLSTVGGYANRIKRNADNREIVERSAEVILEETKRLEELLTDMLALARPARRERQPTDLHSLLDQACLLAMGEATLNGDVEIRKNYDAGLPPVQVDPSSLLRAFLNVIRNAVQILPPGGAITLTTSRSDGKAVVSIADNGPGIPSEYLPTIFSPFVTHRDQGTGLGLAVTQQIVEEHGGAIKVRSEPGDGAEFIFRLPLEANLPRPQIAND